MSLGQAALLKVIQLIYVVVVKARLLPDWSLGYSVKGPFLSFDLVCHLGCCFYCQIQANSVWCHELIGDFWEGARWGVGVGGG